MFEVFKVAKRGHDGTRRCRALRDTLPHNPVSDPGRHPGAARLEDLLRWPLGRQRRAVKPAHQPRYFLWRYQVLASPGVTIK